MKTYYQIIGEYFSVFPSIINRPKRNSTQAFKFLVFVLILFGFSSQTFAQACLGCDEPNEQIIDICNPDCSGGGQFTKTCAAADPISGNTTKCQKITFDLTGIANDCGTDISQCVVPGVNITVFQGCGQSSTSNLIWYNEDCTLSGTTVNGVLDVPLNDFGLTTYYLCSSSVNLSYGSIFITGCCPAPTGTIQVSKP